jgi:hypothetical protein
MKWIDHPNYFGPCRRRAWFPLRLLERRVGDDFSGPPPPLDRALRQLRQHLPDAEGERLAIFITRVESTALLARMHREPETSAALLKLAAFARLGRSGELRPDLLDFLNRAHAALRGQEQGAEALERTRARTGKIMNRM